MKKAIIYAVSLCITTVFFINIDNLSAEDFTGQEEKYLQVCASATLSNTDKDICEQFNTYLKNKNEELKKQINDSSNLVSETKNNISAIETEINNLRTSIDQKIIEIDYLNTSISNLQASIDVKEKSLKDRMYKSQSYMNSDYFVDFIFGANDFADMFSRISVVNELSAYDKGLVQSLIDDREAMKSQKIVINEAKKNLEEQQKTQSSLQSEFLALFEKQNAELNSQQTVFNATDNATKKVEENLDALYQLSKESETGGNLVPGDSAVGNAIANSALSKLSSRYYWGAEGPDYFDCSGLVYWAHQSAGVRMGRATAASYSNSGTRITYSQLQPGDVITFYNYGYVSHIGIYIGNGKMVHAIGRAGTRGQYPNEKVMIADISPGSMFYNLIYNCRRLY